MKGKTRAQKGITLIALIITIVVLLILAAVAISSIQNDGILHYAQNAADNWNKAAQNEANTLEDYMNYLNNIGSGSGSGDDEVATVTPKVGQYVEYDISYDDMYNSTSDSTKTFGKTDGWRYLGTETDEEGKIKHHLLISTGVPMILNYNSTADTNSAQWWDTTQTKVNDRVVEGLKKNLASIPYAKVSAGTTSTSNKNTMIGLFGEDTRTTVGDYFKVTGESYSNSITVRTLTLAELNRAVNSANAGVEGYTQRTETLTSSGFKDIPEGNTALGLFDLSDIGLSNNYFYWLASPATSNTTNVYSVGYSLSSVISYGDNNKGVRPVVVLPSSIQFTDVGSDGLLEIK